MEERFYNVFHRTWWKDNPAWPNGLEPQLGQKFYLTEGIDYKAARELADEYNSGDNAGRYSDKAEIEAA